MKTPVVIQAVTAKQIEDLRFVDLADLASA
jgi:hypothetical protein